MSEPEPISWEYALSTCIDLVCAGLVDKNMSAAMTMSKKKLTTVEGNVGVGKSTLIDATIVASHEAGRPAMKYLEQAPSDITNLFYLGLKAKKLNGGKNPYAALAQMFFACQRSTINAFANCSAGRANDYGFPEFPFGELAKEVWVDRSRKGDLAFMLANWLSGDIDDNCMRAIWAAIRTLPTFNFDLSVYIDCASATAKSRVESRAKANPDRSGEAGMPVEYLSKIRLLHYIIIRECAIRGAPIIVLDNSKYLTGEELLAAVSNPPTATGMLAAWSGSPALGPDATEDQLSDAFKFVLKRYSCITRASIDLTRLTPRVPFIELIIAGMRGGKSTEVIRRVGVYSAANKRVALVKPRIDVRWEKDGSESPEVITHDKVFRKNAVAVAKLSELTFKKDEVDVIALDEAQFFGHELIPYMLENHWFHFIVSGLPATSDLKAFGQVTDCVRIASKITHLNGVCQKCGSFNAAFSPALVKKNSDILVGSEQYGTACHACYPGMNVNTN